MNKGLQGKIPENQLPNVLGKFRAIPKEEFVPEDFVTREYVCMYLGISQDTLKRWYDWYFDEDVPKPARTPSLPYIYKIDGRYNGKQYYARRELEKIARFHAWLPRGRNGIMSGGKQSKASKEELKKK